MRCRESQGGRKSESVKAEKDKNVQSSTGCSTSYLTSNCATIQSLGLQDNIPIQLINNIIIIINANQIWEVYK